MTDTKVYLPDTDGYGMTGDYIPDAWLTLCRKVWPNTPDHHRQVVYEVDGITYEVRGFTGVQGSEISAFRYSEADGWEYTLDRINLAELTRETLTADQDRALADWVPFPVQPATKDRNEFARLALPIVRANTTEEVVRRAGCTRCGEVMHAYQDVRRTLTGRPRARCKPSCDTGDALDVRGTLVVRAADGTQRELVRLPGSCSTLHAYTLTEGELDLGRGRFVNVDLVDEHGKTIGHRTVYPQPADPDAPRLAQRSWSTTAQVRFVRDVVARGGEGGPRTYTAGELVVMHQWGNEGSPVERKQWYSCWEAELALSVPVDAVEVVLVVEESDPYTRRTFRELAEREKDRHIFNPYKVWLLAQAAKETRA